MFVFKSFSTVFLVYSEKFIKFFCLLLFEGTFTSFFKDKKYERSHKTVGIKAFLTIFV